MFDRVLEGQQSMTVDFNGNIGSVNNNLNTKFEIVGTEIRTAAYVLWEPKFAPSISVIGGKSGNPNFH
ncbi:hypothetical protein F2Q70_00039110 [Brassica cretica]|uniref:Uncharacterized protein n=1 Tax=Brassica cretica TaxID=69181 RepID=A0A8S9K8M0_BRACR|nr:hypothetical protein F2Q70_00039110 [Brassica cretica]